MSATKAVNKALNVKNNWYGAFCDFVSIKGYEYYKIPENIRYRYPAPGSVPLDSKSYPHLFKRHWKTPFRDSSFNIRCKDKLIPIEDNVRYHLSHRPDISMHPQLAGAQNQPDYSDISIDEERFEGKGPDHPDRIADLQEAFSRCQEQEAADMAHYSDYQGDYAHEYDQITVQWRDRGFSGFLNDPRSRQMYTEMELWIEEIVGKKQIVEGKAHFYKGEVKKWQVLDDDAFDRDQIENMQSAVQAPLPEELEMYKEKHSKPMQLPFNNANVTAWRDDAKAIDSADFDPELLAIDRVNRKKYFLAQHERPKQLTE